VRRETGKEQVVKVHCDEGVAIHIDPESCVTNREVRREAGVFERVRSSRQKAPDLGAKRSHSPGYVSICNDEQGLLT